MASGKTENYGLSQWEATDQVVRADFNADNQKLDKAIKTTEEKADSAQSKADNLAIVAYTVENAPFVIGCYDGNGAATRTIGLGFTPKAVFVISADGTLYTSSNYYTQYGGLALPGSNAAINEAGRSGWIDGKTSVAIVENGFKVGYGGSSSIGSYTASNRSGLCYHYVALR